ncbi:hypothetical protein G3I44_14265 [Halogeometricum borinquense]|uniref:Uncharacterized protein n=1 Tax=Halogeometricum borinquense TaxID=60847 RepID=A0A6C0UJI7_9EURY|nr:hypothetical protein [Halogeometricum borinquense]QIB75350.1 hypothetical protein G3I44_14265 [Halogeometricum borinquense]
MADTQRPTEIPSERRFDGKKFHFHTYRYGSGARQELQSLGERKKSWGAIQAYRTERYTVMVRTESGRMERRTAWALFTR